MAASCLQTSHLIVLARSLAIAGKTNIELDHIGGCVDSINEIVPKPDALQVRDHIKTHFQEDMRSMSTNSL